MRKLNNTVRAIICANCGEIIYSTVGGQREMAKAFEKHYLDAHGVAASVLVTEGRFTKGGTEAKN